MEFSDTDDVVSGSLTGKLLQLQLRLSSPSIRTRDASFRVSRFSDVFRDASQSSHHILSP
jgi:hypothetical protein